MATTTRQLADFIVEGGVQDIAVQQNPHIQPGTLQPAVAGKLLDGTTNHSGAYGTAQSDGHSYYYTDIKGSRPIKDPRIGAHFGSQRHKFQSLQKLEQESATHGDKVYSIDGREWCRAVGGNWVTHNGPYGVGLEQSGSGGATDTQYIEIVGYFNDVNVLHYLAWVGSNDMHRVYLNGGTVQSTDLSVAAVTPLGGRYVQAHSLVNLTFNSAPTLGINTLKIANTTGHYLNLGGAELIAQDTSNVNNIQIPSQNVVSYGKKFTVSGTPHYDPFNGFTSGSSVSAYVNTATSLGVEGWKNSSTYYRPYNGGRVVWWVDSSGTLKCSVNMMPPNARNISSTASNEKGDDSAGTTSAAVANTQYLPTFTDQAIDHSQAEVAKTFHFREFGNGSANGGAVTSSTGGSYKDASMLYTNADIAYVMDDGLTSFSGKSADYDATHGLWIDEDDKNGYLTFIGTGISWDTGANGINTFAQNLPYGTHIVRYHAGNHGTSAYYQIDGVTIKDDFGASPNSIYNWAFGGASGDITFHQPKKPPIPEDCVVLADYMLYADHVVQTDCEPTQISKGVRFCSGSRDHFVDVAGGSLGTNVEVMPSSGANGTIIGGITGFTSPGSTHTAYGQLPFFGTNAQSMMQNSHVAGYALELGGVGKTETILDSSVDGHGDMIVLADDQKVTLGQTSIKTTVPTGGYRFIGSMVVSPIHTSSHYQSFETPFLHELVGGDRNMEQHNLVVTPDGKTWDEVTRDTSYLGSNQCLSVNEDADTNFNGYCIFSNLRGKVGNGNALMNKDFAIAYDRYICLVAGKYRMEFIASASDHSYIGGTIRVNGITCNQQWNDTSQGRSKINLMAVVNLQRGDYLQAAFENSNIEGSTKDYNIFSVVRVD